MSGRTNWRDLKHKPLTPHTHALTVSRWERLIFRLTGRWPQPVVQRRLDALAKDEALIRRREAQA